MVRNASVNAMGASISASAPPAWTVSQQDAAHAPIANGMSMSACGYGLKRWSWRMSMSVATDAMIREIVGAMPSLPREQPVDFGDAVHEPFTFLAERPLGVAVDQLVGLALLVEEAECAGG